MHPYFSEIRQQLIKRGFYRHKLLNPAFLIAKLIEGSRLKYLHNIHNETERCFIIGNGPSIIRHDLTNLRDEITFVTNWFILHKQYEDIAPNYYCISDSRPFFDKNSATKLIKLLSEKAYFSKMFFPLRVRSQIRKCNLFLRNHIWYLDYILYPIWENGEISLDISNKVYTGDTVVIDFCLPIAYFMGFKKVYLLGCDCSLGYSYCDKKPRKHFYNESKHLSEQQSDLYLKDNWLQHVLTSYEIIKQAFETDDREIINAGYGGNLDSFKRVDYDQLFH